MAQTEAQKRAQKKYAEKNRERRNYLNKRGTAKSFVLNQATLEDLEAIEEYIRARREELYK